MALETATWIPDLVETNPVGGDPVAQGDDHIRMLKRVLRDTFPDSNHAFFSPKALPIDANLTLTAAHNFSLIRAVTAAGSITVNLPAASTVPDGYLFVLRKADAPNSLTLHPNGADTINAAAADIVLTEEESWLLAWRLNSSSWSVVQAFAGIADGSITPSMLTDIAEERVVGRAVGAGTGDPTQLTGVQVVEILPEFSTSKGLAPAATTSDVDEERFLRADGDWKFVSGAPAGILVDEQAAGTAAGTFTSGAWQTRVLQTTKRNVNSFAALAANAFTLPTGTYYIEWDAPAFGVDGHVSRLYNVTAAAAAAAASPGFSANGNPNQNWSSGQAVVTLAAPSALRVEHWASTTNATSGFGRAANLGVVETYTKVRIWRV